MAALLPSHKTTLLSVQTLSESDLQNKAREEQHKGTTQLPEEQRQEQVSEKRAWLRMRPPKIR